MPNEYLQPADGPQHEVNPYLITLQDQQTENTARFRATTGMALDTNPDEMARQKRVADLLGTPVAAVQALPKEADRAAKLKELEANTATSPVLQKKYSDADFARLAHDDSGALAAVEQGFGSALKWAMGNGSSTVGGDAKAAYHAMAGGAAGVGGALARTVGAPLGFLEQVPAIGGNPLFRLSEGFMQIADTHAVAQKAATGKSATWLGGAISGGLQSLAQNAPNMALALVPGGQGAALAAMGLTSGGLTYQKDIAQGQNHWTALSHAASDGTIEIGTEMGPLRGLVNNIKAGSPVGKTLLANFWAENKGEQVATVMQDFNDWAVNDVNQGKSFTDYLKERPEAAAQTAIATLIGVGGNTAILHSVQKVADQASGFDRQAQQAEHMAQALETLQATMQASKLLERSPETLRSYAQDLADEGVPTVYVDSAKLVGAGVDLQALAQVMPSVAAQLEQAHTGGDLAIPTGELLTNTIGTEFAQPLIDHARTDVNGMSREEAKIYMDQKGNQIQSEIERVMAAKENDAEFKAGRDQVQAQILTQLNDIKRFTAKVNDQYATLAANFYAVMAARTGMTVQQFADTYKLGFNANEVAGGMYDQGGAHTPNQPKQSLAPADRAKAAINNVATEQGLAAKQPPGVKSPDAPYESDLFGNAVPAPAGKAGSAARRTKGDVHAPNTLRDTPAPAGEYHVRTIVGAETTRKLGASQITNRVELAQATAYLYRSAVERFDGIVTDKDGKPLGVIGGFKGAISQASVYPGTMVAEAVRIPGAAYVWFSHNHPSGNSTLSRADEALTGTLMDVFRGSGVEPMGTMAVSGNTFSFTNGLAVLDQQEPFDAPTSETPVPVVEREQVPPKSALTVVGSPQDAKRIAAAYYAQAKTPGIILLTAQNHVAAWVPVSPEMTGTLRYTGGLGAIYRAISESNASAAIIVHGGELAVHGNLPGNSTPSANIAAALKKADVMPLDSIDVKAMTSAAEQGATIAAHTLYQEARGQIAFGNDITQQSSIISLLKNADLSTFIHESGHFFLEVQTDLAHRIAARVAQGEQIGEGERSILDDMNKTLAWMGVKATPEMSALDHWAYLTTDEKRGYHEQWARGFEAYAFEGKAPSLDLQHAFQTFRAWLVNVYRALLKSVNASKSDIGDTMKVELSDEVRSVMDRMLATSDQIAEAEAARDMGPLFKTAEQAGMTLEEFKAYHDQGTQATMDAVDELQARGLRDMQWLNNARSRKLKELQKQHDALRARVAREVRSEVLSQPIYRAWTFLTSRATDKVVGEKPVGNAKGLNPEVDNLFTAIAKLGGLDRAEVKKLWGIDEKETLESGVFGAPVVRKTGGLSADAMAERLLEAGYLLPDEHGKADADKFEELFDDQRRGTDRYSIQRDMAAAYGDAPLNLPELPEVGFGKLRTEELRRRYGTNDDAVWRKLSELRMTSDEGGLDPDVVGELFGFSSGDELVKTLAETEPPKSVIEGMTDTRMLQEHGDLATPAGLERAADAAIHNDARAKFVATELKALQKAMSVREKVPGQKNTVDVLARAARDYATAVVAKLRVRDIRPGQYVAAEVRSAKAAAKAVGDIAQATMHKRNQLINLYAAKAAYAAQDEVKSAVEYFKRFDKVSKALGPEYAEQIHGLLERFDLRASTSLKDIDKRKSLVEWVQAQVDQGMEPDIPPELLQEANRKSFKDMTVEEVRGLRDTIKQIEHLGRLKNRLLTAQANRDFQAAVEEISASINLEAGDRKADTRTPNTVLGAKLVGLKNFWAEHIKTATWARIMDGGKDGGPVWEYLIRTANTAGDTEVVMREQATKELAKLVAPVLKEGKMGGKGEFFPSINRTLNKEAKLAIALNMGNESNTQRLLGGEGWSIQQLQPVLNSLSATDWQFVQAVWDHFESYRPAIGEKEKRVYGKEPNWVEPTPVHTPHGVLRGGYYPIKYDPRASERAESHADAEAAKRQLAGAYTSATTRRSFTKSRVEEVNGRPLLYSLDGIYNGVQEVIHDLTWHEWLIDANKLVRNKKIAEAMRSKYGPDAHQQFKRWLEDNAEGDRGAQGAGEKALAYIRQGVSVSGLGLNVMSALIQPLGLTQSIVRIGPKWVGKGVAKYLGAPLDTMDEINAKSDFMRTRALTRLREIAEVRSQVKGRTKVREAIDTSAYFLMMRAQQVADVPTWWGAYEKAIAEGNDESRAVALSDQAVIDSQGSGGVKDQSAIERGGPGIKLFTTFYSFFNTALNLGVQKTMNVESKAKLAADYLLLYSIPVILGAALKDALTPGDSGDWDDWEKILKKLVGEHLSFLLGLMVGVREVTGAAQAATGTAQFGTDYSGPAGVRMLADLVKLGKQLHQGELDDGLRKAVINTAGELLRLPSAQINRTVNGIEALHDGKTQNPGVLLTGYQEPK